MLGSPSFTEPMVEARIPAGTTGGAPSESPPSATMRE